MQTETATKSKAKAKKSNSATAKSAKKAKAKVEEKPKRMKYSVAIGKEAKRMRKTGQALVVIAANLGCSPSTLHGWVVRHELWPTSRYPRAAAAQGD